MSIAILKSKSDNKVAQSGKGVTKMENTIYLVVCKGHPQTLWFRTLAKAKEYCQEYGGDNYSIHEYSLKVELSKEQADKEIAKLHRQKDFDELSEVAERFINKWGCPHSAVIIQQGSIEFLEGVCGARLKILD